jgi:hypothetical protein
MGILNQRIILSCFMGIKTAAKTKYVEYVSFYKTFKSFISFNSGVRYVLFPFSSFVSSKAQTVHLYSLK